MNEEKVTEKVGVGSGISGDFRDIHDKFCQGENGDFPQLPESPPVALRCSFLLSNLFNLS